MHIYQQYFFLRSEVVHEDDCNGTLCGSCGCCIHCMDECPCHTCDDDFCECFDLRCADQWCDECYPFSEYSPVSVDDVRLTWKQYANRLIGQLEVARKTTSAD